MKTLLLVLLSLFIFKCNTPTFEFISAIKQQYAGGTRSSGVGTNYDFVLLAKQKSSVLQIDQLWIGEKYFDITVSKHFQAQPKDGFLKNDTIFFSVKIHFNANENGDLIPLIYDPNAPKPPIKYKGKALIGYKFKGKRKYKTVQKIEELETLMYP